jgi:hypothetical protein
MVSVEGGTIVVERKKAVAKSPPPGSLPDAMLPSLFASNSIFPIRWDFQKGGL